MGSRRKSGAVPATVSGEPPLLKGGIRQRPAKPGDLPPPSSASGRDQPSVRGTRGLFGLHVPPRRHVDVVRRRDEMNALLLIAAIAAPTQNDRSDDTIVVTAAREPETRAEAPVSATIFDRATLDALALPMTADVLRLSPGVAVATSGPRGTQTRGRPRGPEANPPLLFVDGLRFNDPAAANEARFELLTNDA